MSRKSSSSGGSNAYINESKYGGSGYFSQVKSETGSSDISRAYDDIGNDTKQTSSRGDNDAMTVHRRKMMRRAANRRSAQLSRARKKVRTLSSGLFSVTALVTLDSSVPIHQS